MNVSEISEMVDLIVQRYAEEMRKILIKNPDDIKVYEDSLKAEEVNKKINMVFTLVFKKMISRKIGEGKLHPHKAAQAEALGMRIVMEDTFQQRMFAPDMKTEMWVWTLGPLLASWAAKVAVKGGEHKKESIGLAVGLVLYAISSPALKKTFRKKYNNFLNETMEEFGAHMGRILLRFDREMEVL